MYLSKNNFFNILLGLVPISFISGNMLININIILIILSSLFFFGRDLFRINYFFLDKLFFLFFFLVLLTGTINDFYFYSIKLAWKGYFATILKSLFFLKYILLYIVLRYLIEKNILNLKYFFIASFFGTLFVSFDIIYQFVNGEDIFGYKGIKNNLAGPFGNELIAGGYIQRFSIFSFFLIPLFYQQNFSRYLNYLIPILFIIFFITIILSGNRMPLLLFLFSTSLIIIFNKQTRKFFLPALLVTTVIFYLFINLNSKVNENFRAFYDQISKMTVIVIEKDLKNNYVPPYLREFLTFYDTWLMHKYIGGGIKNFRYYCHKRPNIDKNSKSICNMHPHNYYLEILTETGIVGFSLITLAFLTIIHLTLIKKYLLTSALNKNKIIVPFIFLFLAEIFPIKSTGSFFTTGNATYLFIIIGILIGLMRKENLIENKY
jgi:O-antigen ligase